MLRNSSLCQVSARVVCVAFLFVLALGAARAPAVNPACAVMQVDWGGGTPSFSCATVNCATNDPCRYGSYEYQGIVWSTCTCTNLYVLCQGYYHYNEWPMQPDSFCVNRNCLEDCTEQEVTGDHQPLCLCPGAPM